MHGKGSLLAKMPGDRWQQLANLRALYAYMWAHPGKKLLFMGGELASPGVVGRATSCRGGCSTTPSTPGMRDLVRDLNRVYRDEPALWEVDFSHEGLPLDRAERRANNVLAFVRLAQDGTRRLVCIANLSPVPREGYRVGLRRRRWSEVLRHRLRLLRRHRRREPRPGEDGAAALARPAVLGHR